MRKGILSAVSAVGTIALPFVVSAQGIVSTTPQQGIIGLIQFANTALNDVMVLFITMAIVVFFWGLIRYIFGSTGGGEAKAASLTTIVYSIIAIFLMVSIWGVIHLLQATFGVGNSNAAETPSQIQIGGR
jgi:Flp pilus assembly protein protease CpaA